MSQKDKIMKKLAERKHRVKMRKSGIATGATSLNNSDEESKENSLIKISPDKLKKALMTTKNSE